jgi:hypothetical protein
VAGKLEAGLRLAVQFVEAIACHSIKLGRTC